MKESFQKVLDTYKSEGTGRVSKNQETYKLVVHQLPKMISEVISDTNYKITGSVGQGNRTEFPRISILDKNVTDRTAKGLFLVYLFKKNMNGFYLSLNQGYTFLNDYLKNLGVKKEERLKKIEQISSYFRGMVDDKNLSKDPIELENTDYVCPNIISKYYPSNSFSNEELEKDLKEFFNEYKIVVDKLNDKSYEEVINEVADIKLNVDQNLFNYIKENGDKDPMDDPSLHDGSYEIIKKVLECYKNLSGNVWGNVSSNDLFLLLSCCLIRKDSYDPLIDGYLDKSLISKKKQELHDFFDEVWKKAKSKKYTNSTNSLNEKNKIIVGLFSRNEQFKPIKEAKKTLNPKIESFIKMCIAINDLNEDKEDEAIKMVKQYILDNKNIGNFQGKASEILHTIKPKFFPILNTQGRKIFIKLGVTLKSPDKFENYGDCCDEIKKYRNNGFPKFKNYRVIDYYGSKYLHLNKSKGDGINMCEKIGKNMILFGPPGTGKTYNSKIYAVAICEGKTIEEVNSMDYAKVTEIYNSLLAEGRIDFTTFHQSYGYEEFIEGIRPLLNGDEETKINYEIMPGVFKRFCEKAKNINDEENTINSQDFLDNLEQKNEKKTKPCVFIIDEINRGNISKIFGELITLIEESKRDGAPEAMSCTLPYSREKFSVPNNVYIIGTMNTADRSIALMDTALRRRFDFVEMLPNSKCLENIKVDNLDIQELLESINKRIELLYDREHTIGHSYFLTLKSDPSISNLKYIFKDRIIPLLQEYFYDDYKKISLVLNGNGFIKEENVYGNGYFSEPVPDGMLPELKYSIDNNAFDDIANYKKIIRK